MEQELLILEEKLEQLLALVIRLREENTQLSGQLSQVEAEKIALLTKLDTAKHWVEQLIAKIPDEALPEEAVDGAMDDEAIA